MNHGQLQNIESDLTIISVFSVAEQLHTQSSRQEYTRTRNNVSYIIHGIHIVFFH